MIEESLVMIEGDAILDHHLMIVTDEGVGHDHPIDSDDRLHQEEGTPQQYCIIVIIVVIVCRDYGRHRRDRRSFSRSPDRFRNRRRTPERRRAKSRSRTRSPSPSRHRLVTIVAIINAFNNTCNNMFNNNMYM